MGPRVWAESVWRWVRRGQRGTLGSRRILERRGVGGGSFESLDMEGEGEGEAIERLVGSS